MAELASTIWADGPASDPYEPHKSQIRAWGTWLEGIVTAFTSNGGLVYSSLGALNADLSKPANSMAWVVGDPVASNNGVYAKVGSSGSGSWSRRADLPYSFIIAGNDGSGTANAIKATSALPVSGSTLVIFNVTATNTASASVSFNGGPALAIVSASGDALKAGDLRPGMILSGFLVGSTFRAMFEPGMQFVTVTASTGANAIVAATAYPFPLGNGEALIMLPIASTNTSTPVTVSFNGGPALTVKTTSGNDVAVGGLVAGMRLLGTISGATFRLASDQASAAIQAAAEVAANAAVAAAATAQAITGITEVATQPDLLANTSMTYTTGQPGTVAVGFSAFVRSNGASYKVAASGATDQHVTTAGGVKLYEAGPYTTRARAALGVTKGFAAAGEVVRVSGRRYSVDAVGPDGLVAIDFDFSGRLDRLKAKMANGYAAKIAIFTDSTGAGFGTTGYTDNPVDGSQNAVGAGAYSPPNAWPAIMQPIIRDMFGNSGIQIWNASYSGKDLVTNWARRNFKKAVIDNPGYGIPDAVFTSFALNDIKEGAFTPELYETELRRLLSLFDYWNIVPILGTPIPVSERGLRQGISLERIMSVMRSVAKDVGCELIDIHEMFMKVFSRPTTNNRWVFLQPDEVHFGDKGHSLLGAYMAARLFPNTLYLGDEDVVAEAPWAKFCNTSALTYTVYKEANNRFGASMNVTAGSYTAGQQLIRMWVWSDGTARELFWHSLDGDGYFRPRPLANVPTIEITDYLEKATASIKSTTAGFPGGATGRRGSEQPQRVRTLPTGLVKVVFKAPTDTDIATRDTYLGYFSFRKAFTPISASQLIGSSGSGVVTFDKDPFEGANVLPCFGVERGLQMAFEVNLFNGAGVILYASRVFGNVDQDLTNDRRGLMLYRSETVGPGSVPGVALYDVTLKSDGSGVIVGGSPLGNVAFNSWQSPTPFMLRAIVNGSGDQVLTLFSGWTAAAANVLMTVTRSAGSPEALPWGGHIGGFWKNFGESGTAVGGLATIQVVDLAIV